MERKIGETFEYEGKALRVEEYKDNVNECFGCFFDGKCFSSKVVGHCEAERRTDKRNVIFVEVKEETKEQQQEEQKLNLCEILKDCPMYEPFWSPMLGDVKFHHIDHEAKRILIALKTGTQWNINPDATITFANVTSPEIMLFPSKDQRDWSKFTAPWYKKERFDPKTLKPFDRVIVKNIQNNIWHIQYFSHINEKSTTYPFFCLHDSYAYCIPYNDDTKHLVGTTDEAPKFYRYWED